MTFQDEDCVLDCNNISFIDYTRLKLGTEQPVDFPVKKNTLSHCETCFASFHELFL